MMHPADQPTTADYAYADAQKATAAIKALVERVEILERALCAVHGSEGPELDELRAAMAERSKPGPPRPTFQQALRELYNATTVTVAGVKR